VLALGAAAAVAPLFAPFPVAHARSLSDLRFRALWRGATIGEHSVMFRMDGDRLNVETHIHIAVRALFRNVFRLEHEAREVWQSDRLVSVTSTTESTTRAGSARFQVSGNAGQAGFRIVGNDGSFLAAANLLTSDSLWDSRIVHETKLLDVEHGGEIGLVAKPLGQEQVDTPQGRVRASRYQMITPYYAGSVFYDEDQRWVKALVELKGQSIEYVLET
jgi:hypothetical protein